MFVAEKDRAIGLIGVADPIKSSTPEAIRSLHDEGIRIVMLTGDSQTTAKALAGKLGINEVIAEASVTGSSSRRTYSIRLPDDR
jgi:Cu+-exporting ATPase